MVLTQRHGIHAVVIHKGHEGKLGSLQEILNHHFPFAEGLAHQHIA